MAGEVKFGDDEWGKWATSMSERMAAVEKKAGGAIAAGEYEALEKRLDAVEKAVDGLGKGSSGKVSGDVGARLSAVENHLGIGR